MGKKWRQCSAHQTLPIRGKGIVPQSIWLHEEVGHTQEAKKEVMAVVPGTGAWDALTKGLMEAGFAITASWPINTEAESSLHIKDKSAANSTIFLVCRPRTDASGDSAYWEEIEPQVAAAARARIKQFQDAGIKGVDLYLSCFGPALEEFSRHWPLKRGTPRAEPESRKRRRQNELFEEEWDPYAVSAPADSGCIPKSKGRS